MYQSVIDSREYLYILDLKINVIECNIVILKMTQDNRVTHKVLYICEILSMLSRYVDIS